MSTHLIDEKCTGEQEARNPLTFSELVERLLGQSSPPELPDIGEWLAQAHINEDDLKPFLGFKEGNYWRHRVCRNEAVEMLVICWRPGQKTPIHDHNGSHGAVKVQRGVMWESNFGFSEDEGLRYKNGRECQTGVVTGADLPDIHQLGNPDVSGQDLITIHIYAPPLGVLKTYKVGSVQVDLYTPNDFPSDT